MIAHQDYILVAELFDPGVVDAVLEVKKPNSLTFEPIDPLEHNFAEGAYGFYNFSVPASYLDMTGTYQFRITAYELEIFIERECLPLPLSSAPSPDVCVVNGNIRNVSAQVDSFQQVAVLAMPLKLPAISQANLTLGKRVLTYTDHNGFFQLPLIIGMRVLFEIRDTGVRFEATIPDQPTIRIEDLIP